MKPRFIKTKSLPKEKWKEYCKDYWLSNMGRWWSIKSKKILAQQKNDSGYYRVRVYFPCGKNKFIFTHIAVVSLFGDVNGNKLPTSGLRSNGLSVDHISRRKRNNSVNNLEIVKHAENVTRFYIKVNRSRMQNLTSEEIDQEVFG